MTISRSDSFCFWALLSAGMLLLLGELVFLELLKIVVEAVEALHPELTVVVDPVGGVFEGAGFEAAGAPLGFAATSDEAGAFQDFEVLGNGGHGDGEGLGELGDGGFTGDETSENGAASGIGESCEGGGELILHLYLTYRLNTRAGSACQVVMLGKTREGKSFNAEGTEVGARRSRRSWLKFQRRRVRNHVSEYSDFV
jgi:hypothetical protein